MQAFEWGVRHLDLCDSESGSASSLRSAENLLLQELQQVFSSFFGGALPQLLHEVVYSSCNNSSCVTGISLEFRLFDIALPAEKMFEGLPEPLEGDGLL